MFPSSKLYPEKIPFDHRQPASEEIFVGRHRIVDQLTKGLVSGHSYGLVGEAGMGKTSILYALKRKLADSRVKETTPVPVPIYIRLDEFHLAHRGILEAILSGFIDTLNERHGLNVSNSEREALVKEARQGRLEEPLYSLSDWYYRQHSRSCRLILLLDDLHRGLGHDTLNEAVSALRPLVSPKDMLANISLVLSGEVPLEQEFRKDVSSLRGLLSDTRVLNPLLPNDVATLVELAKDYGWSVEPGSENEAFKLTRGYPFKLHYYLFTALDRYGFISQSVLKQISRDPYIKNYLSTVLKQAPSQSRQKKIIHIFYSYDNRDQKWLTRLEQQLAPLRKLRHIQEWHYGKISPGEKTEEQILKYIMRADIILLLISPDYVSSEYLAYQVQVAMNRHQTRKAIVIPILLRRIANWKEELYGKLSALPKREKWLNEHTDTDVALAEIAEELGAVIARLRDS